MLKILRSLQHQVNLQLKKKRSLRLMMIRLSNLKSAKTMKKKLQLKLRLLRVPNRRIALRAYLLILNSLRMIKLKNKRKRKNLSQRLIKKRWTRVSHAQSKFLRKHLYRWKRSEKRTIVTRPVPPRLAQQVNSRTSPRTQLIM